MSEIDRERYRVEAAECVERARLTTDPELKQVMLTRAQEWLKLAYSDQDAGFARLLTEFNIEQMGLGARSGLPDQPARIQQQPMQQQQQRKSDGDK
jgi:hypothetical protein